MRLIIAALLLSSALFAEFRAAVVKVDITPKSSQWLLGYGPRKSTGVLDPIYHRVLAMDDGREQFYLVSSDLCLFSPGLYDEVAAELKKQSGIDAEQFWWSVTHTALRAREWVRDGVYDALLEGPFTTMNGTANTRSHQVLPHLGCPAGEGKTRTGKTADRRWHFSWRISIAEPMDVDRRSLSDSTPMVQPTGRSA